MRARAHRRDMSRFLALVLADARFPAGSHAHSGGAEQAVDDGLVVDVVSLEGFLAGRLESSGQLDACAAARACVTTAGLGPGARLRAALDGLAAALDARLPSPAARDASRAQGRSLLAAVGDAFGREARAAIAELGEGGDHLAIATGVAAALAGLTEVDAALLAAYHSIVVPASAALRLLGLDPVAVAAGLVRLGERCEALAEEAGQAARTGGQLPAPASPSLDLLLERHRERKERLFAS
ncbi:MAG TPA: urease accessory UreF family protein [Acidimicrobiales bacterium]|nr:urease accessory UreF family protein [Acidimicrobiales bacterium]